MMGVNGGGRQARPRRQLDPVSPRPRFGMTGSRPWRIVRAVLIALAVVLTLPYVLAPLYRFVDPVSTLMAWRWASGARVERTWTPIDRIAPALPLAVIVAEDARFCSHHGIDFTRLREMVDDIEDI